MVEDKAGPDQASENYVPAYTIQNDQGINQEKTMHNKWVFNWVLESSQDNARLSFAAAAIHI